MAFTDPWNRKRDFPVLLDQAENIMFVTARGDLDGCHFARLIGSFYKQREAVAVYSDWRRWAVRVLYNIATEERAPHQYLPFLRLIAGSPSRQGKVAKRIFGYLEEMSGVFGPPAPPEDRRIFSRGMSLQLGDVIFRCLDVDEDVWTMEEVGGGQPVMTFEMACEFASYILRDEKTEANDIRTYCPHLVVRKSTAWKGTGLVTGQPRTFPLVKELPDIGPEESPKPHKLEVDRTGTIEVQDPDEDEVITEDLPVEADLEPEEMAEIEPDDAFVGANVLHDIEALCKRLMNRPTRPEYSGQLGVLVNTLTRSARAMRNEDVTPKSRSVARVVKVAAPAPVSEDLSARERALSERAEDLDRREAALQSELAEAREAAASAAELQGEISSEEASEKLQEIADARKELTQLQEKLRAEIDRERAAVEKDRQEAESLLEEAIARGEAAEAAEKRVLKAKELLSQEALGV